MKLIEALTGKLGEQPKASTKGEWIGAGPTVQSTQPKLFTKNRPFQHGKPIKRKAIPTPRAHGSSKDNDYNAHIL